MRKFEFKELDFRGAYIIQPFYAEDERGGFIKDYNVDTFTDNGLAYELKETFYTRSKKGVIRALHFQLGKPQPKLVMCLSGHIYDVIVDLRPWSATYKKWKGFYLTGDDPKALFIPEYFGHGYLVLEDSIVSYKCGESFFQEGDSGIMYNDPDIGIKWPFEKIGGEQKLIISEKDMSLMGVKKYEDAMYKSICGE